MKKITVYTVPGCPFCERLKQFLTEKFIPFEEKPSPPYSESWEEMVRITGSGALPQVLIGDEPIGGYLDVVFWEASGKLYEMLGHDKEPEKHRKVYDVIILGAGPAGLSAAIYTARKMMKTLVLSKNVGGQITWTFDIENYPGFSQINAGELIGKFREHVKIYGVNLEDGVEFISVDLTGRIKRVIIDDGRSFYGKTIIIATGSRHRVLNVPGEKELAGRGLSYCSTCDAPLFAGARVAVVGGGNSALEAVLDLAPIVQKLFLVSLTPLTADTILVEKMKALKEPVEVFLKHKTLRIIGDREVKGIEIASLEDGSTKVLDVEGVFVEIGLMPNSTLFVDVLATNERGEIVVDEQCRTGVAGVFACGDVTNVPFKQIVVAAGEGAKAALSAYHYLLNRK